MKLIPLTKGQFAQVDDDDFERLNQFKWQAVRGRKTFYAVRRSNAKPRKKYRMHCEVAGHGSPQIDHRDGNGLNNQRSNLRRCTQSQNQQNVPKHSNSQNPHKGVNTRKRRYSIVWQAVITVEKKRINLGIFHNPIGAAIAYDTAARQYFGEFARTNF